MSKPLPPKLEDDLNNVKRYKASTPKRDENIPNGSRPYPRRRSMPPSTNLQKVFDDQVERSMYDEIFGHMLPQQRASQQTKFAAGSAVDALRQVTTSSDASSDFTTNLLSRLRLVEKEAKENREKLAVEVIKNEKLTEENARLRRASEEPNYALNQLRIAKKENESLKQQLIEMEDFLADYGLVWVGKEGQRHGQGETDEQEEDLANEGGDIDNNGEEVGTHLAPYSEFAKAVQELNSVIYSEPSQIIVEQEKRKGRLVQAAERVERIKLTYYRNGLMIKNGPFRRTSSDSYRTFASDILDGYFPSEFREMYPDGVIFDLIDRHSDVYYDNIHNSKDVPTVPAQQFLNRLPKTVVQNGNIVNVREDISARLQGANPNNNSSSSNANNTAPGSRSSSTASLNIPGTTATSNSKGNVVMQTFAIRTGLLDNQGEANTASTENSENASNNNNDLKDVVKINIRWIDEKKTVLQAAMFAYDSVLHIRQELALHFGVHMDDEGMTADALELRTAYPAKVLTNEMTLREAGLVPNGTIHARRLTTSSASTASSTANNTNGDGIAASASSNKARK